MTIDTEDKNLLFHCYVMEALLGLLSSGQTKNIPRRAVAIARDTMAQAMKEEPE